MRPVSPPPGATSPRPTRLHLPGVGRNQRTRTSARLALAAAVLSSLVLSVSPTAAATPTPSFRTSGPADTPLDAALNEVVAAGVPGIIVRVHEAHRAARNYTAGVDALPTGSTLRPAARFRIGSITKTFVATIVLQLVGEERMRLDEPVARRLPGLLSNGDRITVRQLLNHTSGLPDYSNDPELFAGIVKNRVWKPQELVAMSQKHPQLFPPGSAFAYSNTNYIVAGLLIEAVAGHSLAWELDRRIFAPLHLDNTSFPVGNAPLPAITPTDTSRRRQYPPQMGNASTSPATTRPTPGLPGPSSPPLPTCPTSTGL